MATAMIVDDAKIMRINIKKILDTLGFDIVAEADNGYDAIEAYKIHKPDLVTMDITMPQKNGIGSGIDAVENIIKYDAKAKIVMITSHGEQEKVIKAIKAGASNYILKPLQVDKFKEAISKIKL